MTFESFAQSPWVGTLARSLAHSLWQGAVLAAVLALVLRFVPSYRSGLRYRLALFGLAGLALLPALNIAVMSATSLNLSAGRERLAGVKQAFGVPLSSVTSLTWNPAIPWEAFATALYALGVVLLVGRLTAQLLYLRRLRRTATPVDETLNTRLRLLADLADTVRTPQLAFSNRIDTAMVMGWRAPLILLPVNVRGQLTPKQLDGVLLHELAHVKTHDYAVNFLQLLVETLLYYHPALWWVSGVVRQEREYRCDDLAARVCGDRRDYAEALLALEKARARPTSAMALAGTSGDFAARIQRLFGRPVPHTKAARLVARLLITLALGVGAGFAEQRSSTPSVPAATAASLRNPTQPESGFRSSIQKFRSFIQEGDNRQGQVEPDPMAKRSVDEPTPTECAALGGEWFHIKLEGLMVEAELPAPDSGIAVPLETPEVTYHLRMPHAEFHGRCVIGQLGK